MALKNDYRCKTLLAVKREEKSSPLIEKVGLSKIGIIHFAYPAKDIRDICVLGRKEMLRVKLTPHDCYSRL